jgi:hypothetical protein
MGPQSETPDDPLEGSSLLASHDRLAGRPIPERRSRLDCTAELTCIQPTAISPCSMTRFADAGHFCSYCRCVPSQYLSNGRSREPAMCAMVIPTSLLRAPRSCPSQSGSGMRAGAQSAWCFRGDTQERQATPPEPGVPRPVEGGVTGVNIGVSPTLTLRPQSIPLALALPLPLYLTGRGEKDKGAQECSSTNFSPLVPVRGSACSGDTPHLRLPPVGRKH